jgi:3'-5' exoribonuclease
MAKRRFINQLMPAEVIDQVFLVRNKDLRTTTSGSLYLTCALCDKTGHIQARMWQVTESIYNGIPVDGFLHVKGRTESYKGTLQLIIDACRPQGPEKLEMADFLPVSENDAEAMWEELLEILRAVKDRHLRLLVKKFVEDRPLVERFKKAPAAMQLHHCFIGGLLEHTLNVARAAKAVLPLYPKLNADLVLVGVFLHDIAKTEELSYAVSFNYTERGYLVGHITLAAIWVEQKATEIEKETSESFPARIKNLLEHLILSHHGEHEFGSPKLPAMPEAFLLHYLDNLDAKIYMTTHAVENDPDPEAAFTSYQKDLQTKIFKLSRE